MYEILKQLPILLTLKEVEQYIGIPNSSITKCLINKNSDNFYAQKIGNVWKVNKYKLQKWL